MVKVVAIIPAHLASVRFSRKILHPIFGIPMIEHVRRRALEAKTIGNVYVATCDQEIAQQVKSFGAEVIWTSNEHKNGTSRVCEAVRSIDCSHVILLQGDEPLLLPRHVDQFVDQIVASPECESWNATGPIEHADELDRHSFVKCAVSPSGQILFCFRRTPFFAPFEEQIRVARKILGIIAFRKDFLLKLTDLQPGNIETNEFIEQMRIIENNFQLRSVPVSPSQPSVNEPHEVEVVLDRLMNDPEQKQLLEVVLQGTDQFKLPGGGPNVGKRL